MSVVLPTPFAPSLQGHITVSSDGLSGFDTMTKVLGTSVHLKKVVQSWLISPIQENGRILSTFEASKYLNSRAYYIKSVVDSLKDPNNLTFDETVSMMYEGVEMDWHDVIWEKMTEGPTAADSYLLQSGLDRSKIGLIERHLQSLRSQNGFIFSTDAMNEGVKVAKWNPQSLYSFLQTLTHSPYDQANTLRNAMAPFGELSDAIYLKIRATIRENPTGNIPAMLTLTDANGNPVSPGYIPIIAAIRTFLEGRSRQIALLRSGLVPKTPSYASYPPEFRQKAYNYTPSQLQTLIRASINEKDTFYSPDDIQCLLDMDCRREMSLPRNLNYYLVKSDGNNATLFDLLDPDFPVNREDELFPYLAEMLRVSIYVLRIKNNIELVSKFGDFHRSVYLLDEGASIGIISIDGKSIHEGSTLLSSYLPQVYSPLRAIQMEHDISPFLLNTPLALSPVLERATNFRDLPEVAKLPVYNPSFISPDLFASQPFISSDLFNTSSLNNPLNLPPSTGGSLIDRRDTIPTSFR